MMFYGVPAVMAIAGPAATFEGDPPNNEVKGEVLIILRERLNHRQKERGKSKSELLGNK